MSYNPSPAAWLTGYSLVSSEAKFRTSTAGSNVTLTKLTDAEANATTGSIAELIWAMCYEFYDAWDGISPVNRPPIFNITKSVTANPDLITQKEVYTFTFQTTTNATNVVSP